MWLDDARVLATFIVVLRFVFAILVGISEDILSFRLGTRVPFASEPFPDPLLRSGILID